MGFACAWFGSRLDEAAKGGDIDLHISAPAKLDNSLWESAQFAAYLMCRLFEKAIGWQKSRRSAV